MGRDQEALAQHQKAVDLNPDDADSQAGLRTILSRVGRANEARAAWLQHLEASLPRHACWEDYATFCLFIGQPDDYRHARTTLLASYDPNSDPRVATQIAITCLLSPATVEELSQITSLVDRAAAADWRGHQVDQALVAMAQGLLAYRQADFERAIAILQSDAVGALRPKPQLVLAMAQRQMGRTGEARWSLSGAILAYDWRAICIRTRYDWLAHVLRREAEELMLPNLAAFLNGEYQPRDNVERISLLGVSLFSRRTRAVAQLYADTFAADPGFAIGIGPAHRYGAMRAAARTGCGLAVDGQELSEESRMRWRMQAHEWLTRDLAAWTTNLASQTDRHAVWATLTHWRNEPLLACVREPAALEAFDSAERAKWLTLWIDVDGAIQQADTP
jgi:serine/threonine-protein kinase